jgi:hypothetical protein
MNPNQVDALQNFQDAKAALKAELLEVRNQIRAATAREAIILGILGPDAEATKAKRGRPAGSKTKPKVEVADGAVKEEA